MHVSEVVMGTRSYLGFPNYGKLPNAVVLFRFYDHLDWARSSLNITAQDWLLERWSLTVDPFQDEFPVNAPAAASGPMSIGRWVLCITDDQSNPTNDFIRQEIPIVTIQDSQIFYIGPKVRYGAVQSPHVATSFNFFTESGQLKVRVTPQHSQSADYLFFYEPDRINPPKLADELPFMQSFANLFKVKLAISLLPEIGIYDPKTRKLLNGDEIKLRGETLAGEYKALYDLFDLYRNQNIVEHKGERIGWASDLDPYDDEYGLGIY